METPLSQNAALIPMIEKIATDIANRIVEQKLVEAQYKPPKVPDHHHNSVDSARVNLADVDNVYTLSGTGTGIISPATLQNQSISQGSFLAGYGNLSLGATPNKIVVTSSPIPTIYGHGGGADSQFNGGDAPDGTLIFFNNGVSISGLWIMQSGTWFGIGQATAGYSNRTL